MSIVLLLIVIWISISSSVMSFQNPILPGFNPDPSIVRVGSTYYIATSTFEFYPGVPIYQSKDLLNWELVGHALNRKENLPLYGTAHNEGIWAPTLRYINNRFYMVTMMRWVYEKDKKLFPRVFWTSSENLQDWTDLVWTEPWGIDPDLFFDEASGKTYLTMQSIKSEEDPRWGIYQCQVDLESGDCLSEFKLISSGTLPNVLSARPEGPHIYKVKEWYYLLIAEGGTGETHRSSILRSKSVSGPWDACPWNPVVSNYLHGTNLTISSTGHADMVESEDGDWYAVFLGRRKVDKAAQLGRETFLVDVDWEQGWPVFNHRRPVEPNTISERSLLSASSKPLVSKGFRDTFGEKKLDLGYYHVRTPYAKLYTLQPDAAPRLRIHPNLYNLGHRDSHASLHRRQKSLNMIFRASPYVPATGLTSSLQEVGISVYASEDNHQDLAIIRCPDAETGKDGQYCVLTRLNRKGTLSTDVTAIPDITNLLLHIRAEPQKYSFGYSCDVSGKDIKWLSTVKNNVLEWKPTGGQGFTGTHFAIYGTGNGKPWPNHREVVGFNWIEEEYFAEDIPAYDSWNQISN